jgi:DNA-binding response OmpR family regulator
MSKRILILDDEMDSNITVEAVLQDNGFKVDSYEDPILALENFKGHFYDLVILDIKMPQMDRFVVYNEIKKLDSRIKVCFLTAGEMYYGIQIHFLRNIIVKMPFVQTLGLIPISTAK